MKNFKITEEQYNMAVTEGLTLQADVQAANGDVKKAVDTTKQQAIKNGVKLDNAVIQINANESKKLSIRDIKTHYIMECKKKHSKLMKVEDFITKYGL
jgi:hypothetical protein